MKLIHFIYVIVIIQFLYPAMVRYAGAPEPPSLLIEFIICGLFIISILLTRHVNILSNRVIIKYIFLFTALLIIIFLSALINSTRWMLVIKSIIEYNLLYIFLFFAIIFANSSENQQVHLIKLIQILILIQIPVTLLQYFFETTMTSDSISGTLSSTALGGTGTNAVLSAILLSIIISRLMTMGFNKKDIILILLMFIPSLLGGARFGFILLPIAVFSTIIGHLYIKGTLKVLQVFYLSLTTIIVISGIFVIFNNIAPETKHPNYIGKIDMIIDPNKMIAYDESGSSKYPGRLGAYKELFSNSLNSAYTITFGLGSGAITKSSSLSITKNRLTFVSKSTDNIKILGSVGIVGLLLIWIILISNIMFIKKYLVIEKSKFMQIYGYAFIPITIIILISLAYTEVWTSQIGIVYWILFGIFVKRYVIYQRGISILKEKLIEPNYLNKTITNT